MVSYNDVTRNLLLTGAPGCGKTSLIQEVVGRLKIKTGGFLTSEIREKGVRKGFKIAALDGKEAILSHVDFKGPHRVSRYVVSVENLEEVGLQALRRAIDEADLIIIDEIGKMELFSDKLREAILNALDSEKKVLGAIMQKSHPFADNVKKRRDTKVLELTRENRSKVMGEVLRLLGD